MRHWAMPPLTWAALSLSLCPRLFGAHGMDWCGVCAWSGLWIMGIICVISFSLLVSDDSFCCSLSPLTPDFSAAGKASVWHLSPEIVPSQPLSQPLSPHTIWHGHPTSVSASDWGWFCSVFQTCLILQIYLSTLCNLTSILPWSCCVFNVIYVLQFLKITGVQWDSHYYGYPHMEFSGFWKLCIIFRWKVIWICCF